MKRKFLPAVILLSLVLAGCNRGSDQSGTGAPVENQNTTTGSGASQTDTNAVSPSAPQADNTGRNVRDRSDSTLTPGDQGGSEADRDLTQRIRRAITSNDQLSADAKNIKIITINGKVTLRGPVKDEQERKTIESILQQAGVTSVDNQLEVKGMNQ